MSEGETPLILDAWPIVAGWITLSFCLPSVDIECSFSNSKSLGILMFSRRFSFFTDSCSLFRYPPYFIAISVCSIAAWDGLSFFKYSARFFIFFRSLIEMCGLNRTDFIFTFCLSFAEPFFSNIMLIFFRSTLSFSKKLVSFLVSSFLFVSENY